MSDGDRGQRNPYLRGDFLAIAVLAAYLLVGALAFHSGRQNERRTYEPHQHAISAADAAQERCADREPRAMAECIIEQVTAAEETSRSEQDLEAQQQMALWALLMVLVSAGTIGVTIWALIYIKRTLDETKRMADDTKTMAQQSTDATKAMVRQNEISEDAQRPWLSVEIVKLGPFEKRSGSYFLPYTVRVKNSGTSPALIARCNIMQELRTADGALDVNAFIASSVRNIPLNWFALVPGQSHTIADHGLLMNPQFHGESGEETSLLPDFLIGVVYQDRKGGQEFYTIHRIMPNRVLRKDARDGETRETEYYPMSTLMT